MKSHLLVLLPIVFITLGQTFAKYEALEIGNRINVLKSETVQLEAVQKEVIGRLKEIDVTRETFTKKSKPSTEVPKK